MSRLNKLLQTDLRAVDQFAVGADWKSFDARIPAWLLNIVFDILREVIDFSRMTTRDGVLEFTPDKADEYRQAFEFIEEQFIYSKIMLPDGTVVLKEQGIPSGSYLT